MRRLAYLFVPANSEKMIEKGIHSKADAIIFDLEDAVAHEEKQRARDRLVNKLGSHRAEHFFVRINDLASEFWEADVEAIDQLPEYRLVIPKVTCAKDINIVEQRATNCAEILPIIESAEGMWNVMEIAKASSKVKQFAFGAEDYRLDLNIEKSANDEALLHARSQIVLASKVAGLAPPIDSVFVNLHDSEGFKSESVRHRQLGFQGKLLIHPKQIEDLQSIYAVTDKEYEQALTICKAFEDAQSQGIASISVNGQMVDYPVYKQRKQLVERYESNQ